MKGMICEGGDTKILFGVLVFSCVVFFGSLLSEVVIANDD